MTDAISSTRLVRLLQLQLEARSRKRSNGTNSDTQAPVAPNELRDLIRRAGGNEEFNDALRRAVIEHILADRLGPHLRTEQKFQQVLDRVHLAIADHKEWAALLDKTIGNIVAG